MSVRVVWIGWRACGGDARAVRSYPAQTRGLELSGGCGCGSGSGREWELRNQGLGVMLWDVGGRWAWAGQGRGRGRAAGIQSHGQGVKGHGKRATGDGCAEQCSALQQPRLNPSLSSLNLPFPPRPPLPLLPLPLFLLDRRNRRGSTRQLTLECPEGSSPRIRHCVSERKELLHQGRQVQYYQSVLTYRL